MQFVSDMNELPKLVEETHENFDMKELSADKGYLSDNNLMFLDKLGVTGLYTIQEQHSTNNR